MTKEEFYKVLRGFKNSKGHCKLQYRNELRTLYESLPAELKKDKEVGRWVYDLDFSSREYLDTELLSDAEFITDHTSLISSANAVRLAETLQDRHILPDYGFAAKFIDGLHYHAFQNNGSECFYPEYYLYHTLFLKYLASDNKINDGTAVNEIRECILTSLSYLDDGYRCCGSYPMFRKTALEIYENLPEEYNSDHAVLRKVFASDVLGPDYVDTKFLRNIDILLPTEDEDYWLFYEDLTAHLAWLFGVLQKRNVLDKPFAWKIYECMRGMSEELRCEEYDRLEEYLGEYLCDAHSDNALDEAYHIAMKYLCAEDTDDLELLFSPFGGVPECVYLNLLKKQLDGQCVYNLLLENDEYMHISGSEGYAYFMKFDTGLLDYCKETSKTLYSSLNCQGSIILEYAYGWNTQWFGYFRESDDWELDECFREADADNGKHHSTEEELSEKLKNYQSKRDEYKAKSIGVVDFTWGYPQYYLEKKWTDIDEKTREYLLKEKITIVCDDVIIDYKLERKNYGKEKRMPDSCFENNEFCAPESRWMTVSRSSEDLDNLVRSAEGKIIEFDGTVKEWIDIKYNNISEDNLMMVLCEDGTVMPVSISHNKSPLSLAYVSTKRGFPDYHNDYPNFYISYKNYFGLIYYVQRYLIMSEGRAYKSFLTEISCRTPEEEEIYARMQKENPEQDFNYYYDALDFDNFMKIRTINGIS